MLTKEYLTRKKYSIIKSPQIDCTNTSSLINDFQKFKSCKDTQLTYQIRGKPFWEACQMIISTTGLHKSEIIEYTAIDKRTLNRMLDPNRKGTTRKETLISFCLGLKLDYDLSIELLHCHGTDISGPNDEIYRYLLRYTHSAKEDDDETDISIYDCNHILLENGYPKLTKNG